MKTIEEAAKNYAISRHVDSVELKFVGKYQQAFKAGAEFAQRWISVEEELPEIDESGESDLILMKIDHFVYVGNYTEDREWVELITREKYTPTHWRPIELK